MVENIADETSRILWADDDMTLQYANGSIQDVTCGQHCKLNSFLISDIG